MIVFTDTFATIYHHLSDEMTKVIAVLRHAQSVGKQSGQRDYDRPLTPLGVVTARTLGKKFKEHRANLDLILSSNAVRARQTVDGFNQELQIPGEKIHFKDDLYDAMMIQWLTVIHALPENIHRVLLVGHNPWLSIVATSFSGDTIELDPCQLVSFEFALNSWKEIGDQGRLILNLK